ncbi:MAG: HAD family phosphatase [Waddliaceae bacterium]
MIQQLSLHNYQLYLFDFDGLLVNTEGIHYEAYRRMCANRGIELNWTFSQYCRIAHKDAETLKISLYAHVPQLVEQEPDWHVLYREKKEIVIDLLNQGSVHMMPGAEELLKALQKANLARCVVTNSPEDQIRIIKDQNPILATIPVWITRESYTLPKPHPECYLTAIEKLGKPGDKAIGFEDTPRGVRALLSTSAQPILVTQVDYPEIPQLIEDGALHAPCLPTPLYLE